MIEEVSVLFTDLEDIRQILNACSNFFMAEDLQRAQLRFGAVQPSALTTEVQHVKSRVDGYIGDYLLAKHEAEMQADEVDYEPEEEDDLSPAPLGSPSLPQREGREVTRDELLERESDDAE